MSLRNAPKCSQMDLLDRQKNALFHVIFAIMGTIDAHWKVSHYRNDRVNLLAVRAFLRAHPANTVNAGTSPTTPT